MGCKSAVEAVREGGAELGLISFPKKWPDLTVIPWREEEMVVTMPPSHRFAILDSIEIGQLDGESFVAFESDLAIRRAIDRFLRKHGAQIEITLEFDNIENIKRAVEDRAGVAILPEPTLRREVRAGTLAAVPIRDRRLSRPIALIHRGAGQLGVTATRFLELLTQAEDDPVTADTAAVGSVANAS
jgi:DNA-binding transcriptional LysR family regulator